MDREREPDPFSEFAGFSDFPSDFPEPEPEAPRRFRLPGIPSLGNPFEDAKPLSRTEETLLRPILMKALVKAWEYADEGISTTNKQHADAYIWQRIDNEDTEILAEALLSRARQSAVAAQMVRGLTRAYENLTIGLILVPKFLDTWRFYTGHGGFGL